ncbi:putative reverse transcriptase domain-containing protein [Tanacetum coccineum]|uniref:Reverse transcriptase domain-containing protein n=1 Tax=Tanacetum coccineum TaxID=301880 RepID=A0ABQ5E3M5_9ASTR
MSTAYHPKTEKAYNTNVRGYAESVVIDFGRSWNIHLPLAEFSYNNSYHSSIRCAPFEALYGRKSRSPVVIRDRVKAARDRQKSCADNRRKPLEFQVGNKTLRFVEEPLEIMDREVKTLKRSKIPIVKVRWNSERGPEFTWKREDHMKATSAQAKLFEGQIRSNPGVYEVELGSGVMAFSVISISSNSLEESVGTSTAQVILSGTIPTTIPSTTPTTDLPVIHDDTSLIPTDTPTISPTIPTIPSIALTIQYTSPFIDTDSSNSDIPERPPSQDPYEVTVARWRIRIAACSSPPPSPIHQILPAPPNLPRRPAVLVMAFSVISISLDSSEESVETSTARFILFNTILTIIPSTTPTIDLPIIHNDTLMTPTISPTIPPIAPTIQYTSPFICTDSFNSDTPDTPPSQDPYEVTVARWRSRVAARSSPPSSPIRQIFTAPTQITPPTSCSCLTGTTDSCWPTLPYPSDPSSLDSHSDTSSDSSSRHSSSSHSISDFPCDSPTATSARPSRKRCRSATASIYVASPVRGTLSPVRANLLPPHKRIRDSDSVTDLEVSSEEGYVPYVAREVGLGVDVEDSYEPYTEPDVDYVIQADIDACIAFADDIRARGTDVRVIVETVADEEVESSARGTIEVEVGPRVGPVIDDDVRESVREDVPNHVTADGAVDVTYETLGDLVQRFHDHTIEIPAHPIQLIESVQRFQGHRIAIVDLEVTAMTERIGTLERDNVRLRGMLDVERQRVDRLHRMKSNDLATYNQRFQELTLLCTKMVSKENDNVEKYIGGLPDNIQGNVIAAEPTRLQDAIRSFQRDHSKGSMPKVQISKVPSDSTFIFCRVLTFNRLFIKTLFANVRWVNTRTDAELAAVRFRPAVVPCSYRLESSFSSRRANERLIRGRSIHPPKGDGEIVLSTCSVFIRPSWLFLDRMWPARRTARRTFCWGLSYKSILDLSMCIQFKDVVGFGCCTRNLEILRDRDILDYDRFRNHKSGGRYQFGTHSGSIIYRMSIDQKMTRQGSDRQGGVYGWNSGVGRDQRNRVSKQSHQYTNSGSQQSGYPSEGLLTLFTTHYVDVDSQESHRLLCTSSSGHADKKPDASGRVFALTQDQAANTSVVPSLPIVSEFLDVFPRKNFRLPPIRDVVFNIEHFSRCETISKLLIA